MHQYIYNIENILKQKQLVDFLRWRRQGNCIVESFNSSWPQVRSLLQDLKTRSLAEEYDKF